MLRRQPHFRPVGASWVRWAVAGWLLMGLVACNSTSRPVRHDNADPETTWPKAEQDWHQTTILPAGWARGKLLWQPASFPSLEASLPVIPGSREVGDDRQCILCHEAYVRAYANNVHRNQSCEKCHGAASLHIESRGKQPASILSLKRPEEMTSAGKALSAAQRDELCLQCHQTGEHPKVPAWRTSAHAHNAVTCADCHTSHYNVPPGTPPTVLGMLKRHPEQDAELTGFEQPSSMPSLMPSLRGTSRYLAAITPGACYKCHDDMKRLEDVMHPHRIGAPLALPGGGPVPQGVWHGDQFDCMTCHDPHGNVLPETRRNLCLKCHEGPHMDQWHGSPHDVAGIGCTDCHNPHPKTGMPMTVDQPRACYRCHSEKRSLEELAHAHQINGPNGFQCTTCHQPHGRVTSTTRTDLCLHCHQGAPTMAWHSSVHFREGVACADCHNAHPDTRVPRVVPISHATVQRPQRLPMSVAEPAACFKCHPKIFGLTSMPSHHPIKEGKMVCSACHDAHGQQKGNLKADTLNDLCYRCHAEKQGPFAWEHAPVTENCGNCHEPHGTVANNLLRQPTTFLCLRCHTGHSTHNASPQCTRCHFVHGDIYNVGGGPRDPTIPTTPAARQALFTDCTQCHTQIHGSDLPSGFECGHGMRR